MTVRRARVAIGLGVNLGDRIGQLRRAAAGLRELLDRVRVSSVFETAPLYVRDQPAFLNACCTGRSRLTPRQLLSSLQDLERRLGRSPAGQRFGPRDIDLDLLLYDDLRVEKPDLILPHPRMRERAFVLVPLAELAADWMVPASGGAPASSVGRLASEIDPAGVELTNLLIEPK